MSEELAFVLINPYTIAKSRTGGVIARFIGRTGLRFVSVRMFGPSKDLVEAYVNLLRKAHPDPAGTRDLIADYVLKSYMPDSSTGRPQRVMLLLFEGDDAVDKVWRAAGIATLKWGRGETIRDTYGDYVVGDNGKPQYFEPAVLVAPTKKRAAATLRLWARYSKHDGGIISHAADVPEGDNIERTLVLIKPDNFQFPSSRPGSIIDLLSVSRLRIVGAKRFSMSISQAHDFYGPVHNTLETKFLEIGPERVARALRKEFNIEVPSDALDRVCHQLAPLFAKAEFEKIVTFMSGQPAVGRSWTPKRQPGDSGCFALIYEGTNAIKIIRSILGSTDPGKAVPGTIRREFGSNITMNAAHASDSHESAQREMDIIKVEEDTITRWIKRYYRDWLCRAIHLCSSPTSHRRAPVKPRRNLQAPAL